MDRGPAQPQGRVLGDGGEPAVRRCSIALLLARGRFWGKSLLDGIVHLPLVMPPVVTGYLLLLAFGRRGADRRLPRQTFRHRLLLPLDRRGAGLRRSWAFPLMVRAIRLSIEAVDRRLEDAAGTLGAHRAWVFLTDHAAADPARRHRRR